MKHRSGFKFQSIKTVCDKGVYQALIIYNYINNYNYSNLWAQILHWLWSD